ncbi:MAG: hypothetical protein JW704_13995, partial [Anaerolineaceae bacterium]|nr:hypothetical protein [Anaerolineaceae bacterium]
YYVRHRVTLTSQQNPAQNTRLYLQSAVSAPFAQIYQDNTGGSRLYMERILPSESFSHLLSYPYNGSFMSMSMLAPGHYIVAWHEGSLIRYRLFHQSTGIMSATRQFTASPIEADDPVDLTPSVAYSRNGRIGILYLFNKYRTPTLDDPPCTARVVNSNIYLTVLNANGVIIPNGESTFFNITQKEKYVCLNGGTEGSPQYWYPRIVPVGQDSFGLVWQEHYAGNNFDKISYAVYKTDGTSAAYKDIEGASDVNKHITPAATGLADGRFMIGFVNYTGPSDPYQLRYSVINTSAEAVIDKEVINGANSKEIDIAQLPDGKVIFTWTSLASGWVAYAMLAADLFTEATTARDLTYEDHPGHSNYRSMGGSSV